MSAGRAVQKTVRHVKPLVSHDSTEARSRVVSLYKAWYRQCPFVVFDYQIPVTTEQCRARLREMFESNRHIKDVRVIDALVLKGQMELKETTEMWKQQHHIMSHYFKETVTPRPTDFMSKFLSGQP